MDAIAYLTSKGLTNGRSGSEEVVELQAWLKGVAYPVLVDAEDVDLLSAYSWRLHSGGYAIATVKGSRSSLYMHRLLMGFPPRPFVVDHINRNKLDNRRANLRVVTQSINMHNIEAHHDSKTGVKGVSPFRNSYVARVMINRKHIHIGTFKTVEEAKAALDQAVVNG